MAGISPVILRTTGSNRRISFRSVSSKLDFVGSSGFPPAENRHPTRASHNKCSNFVWNPMRFSLV
jgi:hypothetical protein